MRIEIFADNECAPPEDVFRVVIYSNDTVQLRGDRAVMSFNPSYIPGIVAALEEANRIVTMQKEQT